MPARTLSSEPELLSPLRYAPYVQSPPPFDHPEQPRPDLAIHLHNRSYPPNVAHIHRNHQGITHQDYVYPAMAPPMQRTDDLAFRVYPVVPSQWSTHSSSLAPGWLPHHPTMAPIPPMAPPPALLHKVWIVDCKACDTFLTNRGMKVSADAFCRVQDRLIFVEGGFAVTPKRPTVLDRRNARQLLCSVGDSGSDRVLLLEDSTDGAPATSRTNL